MKALYVNRALLKSYADASGDQNPIHQNEEFAVSVGLPNVIAQRNADYGPGGKARVTIGLVVRPQ
jgi:hypothetical protein